MTETVHAVVSHGADFFGEDRHAVLALRSLAPVVSGAYLGSEQETIAPLLAVLQDPGERSIPAEEAALLAEQLLHVSRARHTKPNWAALARALADAAARAAADCEPWVWRIETGMQLNAPVRHVAGGRTDTDGVGLGLTP